MSISYSGGYVYSCIYMCIHVQVYRPIDMYLCVFDYINMDKYVYIYNIHMQIHVYTH